MTKDSIRYYDDEYKNKMREEVRLLAETFKNDTSLLAGVLAMKLSWEMPI